jgi:hypothetical protein
VGVWGPADPADKPFDEVDVLEAVGDPTDKNRSLRGLGRTDFDVLAAILAEKELGLNRSGFASSEVHPGYCRSTKLTHHRGGCQWIRLLPSYVPRSFRSGGLAGIEQSLIDPRSSTFECQVVPSGKTWTTINPRCSWATICPGSATASRPRSRLRS